MGGEREKGKTTGGERGEGRGPQLKLLDPSRLRNDLYCVEWDVKL